MHGNLLGFVKLAKDTQGLLIVTLVAQLCCHLDLILDLLAVVHHVDG